MVGHEDGITALEFADSNLYSGSYDHSIRSWDLKEMHNRIRERIKMFAEDIWSHKYEAWYNTLYKKKKKKGKKGKKKWKELKIFYSIGKSFCRIDKNFSKLLNRKK